MTYNTGFDAIWLGNRDIQQAEINKINERLSTVGPGTPEYEALVKRLGQYEAGLKQNMYQQGVTDEFGRIKDVYKTGYKEYMPTDYLKMRGEQIQSDEQGALTSGLKLAKQQQMQTGQTDLGQAIAQQEAIRRQSSGQFGQEVYGAQQQAKQEAAQAQGTAMNFASTLTQARQKDVEDLLNQQAAAIGMDTAKVNAAINALNAMPAGLGQQLLELIGKGAGGAVLGALTGDWTSLATIGSSALGGLKEATMPSNDNLLKSLLLGR